MTAKPLNPFGRIALSLSGGGFRAAAFNIGMMSFLNKINFPTPENPKGTLLDRVVFMASASGGSFPAAFYGMYKLSNKSFDECYRDFLKLLHGDGLLQKALATLNDDAQWNPSGAGKRRNLINAFSKVYDQEIFKGEVFGIFDDRPNAIDFSVCFNSTEFYRGLSFRFQIDSSPKSREYLGNKSVYFKKSASDSYRKLKLGDILASSSCFPAGFEPIVWPHDFTYSHSLKNLSLSEEELKDTIVLQDYDTSTRLLQDEMGLMDGGINDNQALYSTMQADDRSNGHYDLVIVSDVASYFMDPYEEPSIKPAEGIRKKTLSDFYNVIKNGISTVRKVLTLGIVGSLIGLVAAIALIVAGGDVANVVGYSLFGFALAVLLISMIAALLKKKYFNIEVDESDLQSYIKHYLSRLRIGQNFSQAIIDSLITYLSKTKLGVLENMLKTRAYSVLIMTMDVNLKQVRRLIYEMFFSDERFTNRRVYNVIYELSSFNDGSREFRIRENLSWKISPEQIDILLRGTDDIQNVAESARKMGTTLWFDQDNEGKLRDIVACGQFTICSNMLEYVMSLALVDELTATDKATIAGIESQLLAQWEMFKENPYAMY